MIKGDGTCHMCFLRQHHTNTCTVLYIPAGRQIGSAYQSRRIFNLPLLMHSLLLCEKSLEVQPTVDKEPHMIPRAKDSVTVVYLAGADLGEDRAFRFV